MKPVISPVGPATAGKLIEAGDEVPPKRMVSTGKQCKSWGLQAVSLVELQLWAKIVSV